MLRNVVNSLCEVHEVSFERVYCVQTIEDPIVSVEVHRFCDPLQRFFKCWVYLSFFFKE